MSQINQKSISGITSITTPAGVDNQLTVHTFDTSEKLKVTSDGVKVTGVVTAIAADIDDFLDVGSNIQLGNAGVITATSFSGSGANLTGIDATAIKDSGGNVKIQAQASGAVYTGIHTFTNETHIVKSGSSSFLVGSTNAGGATIALDGDSNGDGGGADYAFLQHNSDGDLYIVADNPSNASNIKFFTSNTSEKMSLTSQGQLKLSGNNTGNHMFGFGSNVGGLTIDDVGNQHTALEVQHGSNKAYLVASSNNSVYLSSYGTGSFNFEHTGSGGSRTRMQLLANGNVSVANTIDASQMKLASTTTAVRNTGVSTAAGTMIFNSSLNKLQVYSDNSWVSFSGKKITVSGGTISNSVDRTGYVVHTFTSPGTFSTDAELEGVEVMVVGGGGGGGGHRYGSGGGAGGVIMRPATPAYPISSPAPVVIGSGGSGGPGNGTGGDGSNSTFGSGPTQLIGKGGGGGTSYDGPQYTGRPGGSGSGGTARATATPGGSATQPGTHGAGTDYGNRGGYYNVPGGGWAPAGGGGAGAQGTDTPTTYPGGGNGGVGVQLSISGSATYYAGGGAGGIYNNLNGPGNHNGIGGNGGGGSAWNSVPGSYPGHSAPGAGASNSGGGGCGAHGQNPGSIPINNALNAGLAGGSGIVIVAYPTNQPGGDIFVS